MCVCICLCWGVGGGVSYDSNEEGKVTDSASCKQLPCLSPAC